MSGFGWWSGGGKRLRVAGVTPLHDTGRGKIGCS